MTSGHFCLDRRVSNWARRTAPRYRSVRSGPLVAAPLRAPARGRSGVSQNGVERWDKLSKVGAHISSGRLLARSELYVSFYTGFSCFGGTSPVGIRSRRAVAGFGVMKGAVTGLSSTLRGRGKTIFCYKWAFVEPGLFVSEKRRRRGRQALRGVGNVFAFPELERFNYNLFAPLNGFDLAFHYTDGRESAAIGTKNAEKTT